MKASIIIPVYNAELYIEKCINSVLNQTFVDYELILVDDNSTDASISIVEKLMENNLKIKLVRKDTNSGVSDARNIGIEKAKGEYIFFVDSDDFLEENYLEELIELQERYPKYLITTSYVKFSAGKSNQYIKHETGFMNNVDKYGALLNDGYLWNKVFKKEILVSQKIQMKRFKRREDLLFVFEYSQFVEGIFSSSIILYNYRQHQESSTSKLDSRAIDSYLVTKELQKIAPENNSSQQSLRSELYSSLAIYLLKLYRTDDKNFKKLWDLYIAEGSMKFRDFKYMSNKRKLWVLLFLLKKQKLKKYNERLIG